MTPQPMSAASAMGISSGIFTRPFSEVTISSAKEPTEENCRMGLPFQVRRLAEAAPMPGSLHRLGRPPRQ